MGHTDQHQQWKLTTSKLTLNRAKEDGKENHAMARGFDRNFSLISMFVSVSTHPIFCMFCHF